MTNNLKWYLGILIITGLSQIILIYFEAVSTAAAFFGFSLNAVFFGWNGIMKLEKEAKKNSVFVELGRSQVKHQIDAQRFQNQIIEENETYNHRAIPCQKLKK